MKKTELSFYGSIYSNNCPGCERSEPQPEGLEIVFEDNYFRVHQDYAIPIPGMMIIEIKRHISSITDFNQEELLDFVTLISRIRAAMKTIGIMEATFVQEERSPHFHAWWLPNYPWMIDITNGNIRDIQQIFDYSKKYLMTPDQFQKVETATSQIKSSLSN